MSTPENPAAFPCTGEGFSSPHYTQHGMTLRDWFAGRALASIISAVSAGQHSLHPDRPLPESFATDAYAIADAMLFVRAQGGTS